MVCPISIYLQCGLRLCGIHTREKRRNRKQIAGPFQALRGDVCDNTMNDKSAYLFANMGDNKKLSTCARLGKKKWITISYKRMLSGTMKCEDSTHALVKLPTITQHFFSSIRKIYSHILQFPNTNDSMGCICRMFNKGGFKRETKRFTKCQFFVGIYLLNI